MDKTSLLIKNLPDNIRDIDVFFKNHYGAVKAKSYGRRRAIVKFSNKNTAKEVLYKLHQHEMEDRILSVEYVFKQKSLDKCDNQEKQEEDETLQQDIEQNTCNENQKIPNFLKTLYGINPSLDFNQPPPPYLKYYYPKINRSILDSISIALLTVPKFYIQVLHLMNRMNLDPPFLPLQKPLNPPGELINAQTQTDNDNSVNLLLSDDESELESDNDDENHQIKIQNIKRNESIRKRKGSSFNSDLIIKKKAKKLIQQNIKISELKQNNSELNKSQIKNLNEIFENDSKMIKSQKIEMNVTNIKLPECNNTKESRTINDTEDDDDENKNLKMITNEDLKFNRIPENQLKDLPVFRNYVKGEKSNKLYIKNLSKDVTVEDLEMIYNRFTASTNNIDLLTEKLENNEIHIKLMQHGKMKGQAFVTFTALKDDNMDVVEKALNETNGYILKKKPMIVCFGKKS